MDDLIYRQEAIEAVCRGCSGDFYQECQAYHGRKTFCDQIKRLRAVPSAQRWISVTERLPEEDGRYLITGRVGTVYSLEYEDGRWGHGIEPIAWMPLPEPFK